METIQETSTTPQHESKLTKAILCTVFFGFFGIPAIIFSTWANTCADYGDHERASKLNQTARKCININLWVGIAMYILLTVYFIFIFAITFATVYNELY